MDAHKCCVGVYILNIILLNLSVKFTSWSLCDACLTVVKKE